MRKRLLVLQLITCALLAAGLAFPVDESLAQRQHKPTEGQRNTLKAFLQDYVKAPNYDHKETRYVAAFIDLRDDGTQQAIVYFTDRSSCGSGGCSTLIVEPEGSSYRVVTSITIVRLPIRVLSSKSNGWHDISVVVAGGGIQLGYEAMLSFDGKTYPTNPTVPLARRINEKVSGKVVIPPKVQDDPLYP